MEDNLPCDPEDIMCRAEALAHLKGLQAALGGDKFKAEFPELEGLDEKIQARDTALRETLSKCLLPQPVENEPPKAE
jgi:hypothetical protein